MLESLGIVYMNVTTVRKYITVLQEINRPETIKCDDVKSDKGVSSGKLKQFMRLYFQLFSLLFRN